MGRQYGGDASVEKDATGVPQKKEQARPVKRVLDRNSQEVVGWLYEWNTGHLAVMWKDGKREDVIYA